MWTWVVPARPKVTATSRQMIFTMKERLESAISFHLSQAIATNQNSKKPAP